MFDSLLTLWTLAHQAPLSMGFSRQKYWSRLPFPPPGDLSDPGIEHVFCVSCIGRWILYHWATWKAPPFSSLANLFLKVIRIIYLFVYYWHIIDSQCCICITVQQIDQYMHSFLYSFPLWFVPGYRMESPLYIGGPSYLPILYIIVASTNPELLIHPSPPLSAPWQPQVCSLCLWVCFFLFHK